MLGEDLESLSHHLSFRSDFGRQHSMMYKATLFVLFLISSSSFAFTLTGSNSRDYNKHVLFSAEQSEEEVIRSLRGSLGITSSSSSCTKAIFIISDATAQTAKHVVEKSLTQFNGCDDRFQLSSSDDDDDCELLQTKLFSFCKTELEVADVIRTAAARHISAMVVFTLADPDMREKAGRMCELEGLDYVDLLGPMFGTMATFLNRQPLTPKEPSKRRLLSDTYYRRIDAVEYTLKADDGMAPWLLAEADVIITGVSRTGKTPLSVVLSQTMGLKVANVPLVQEVPPPRQLLDRDTIDSRRVFCLTLNPADLERIRKNRLQRDLIDDDTRGSNYADRKYLIKDLMNAKRLTDDYDWTEIDVSGRAVEETSSLISSILKERFPEVTGM